MLAVLNHELGHWNLGHIVKNIILSQMNYFLCFFLACYINWLKRSFLLCLVFLWQPLCSNWTIDHLSVYFPPLLWGLSFCLLALSHRCDFQADTFAKMLGKAKDIFCFNQTKQKQLWVPCVWVNYFQCHIIFILCYQRDFKLEISTKTELPRVSEWRCFWFVVSC